MQKGHQASIASIASILGLTLALPAQAEGPLQLFSVAPCRLADTRDAEGPTGGPAIPHGGVRSFPVYGSLARNCGIPPTARGVALNVAVVGPTSFGYLTVYPYGAPFPGTSTINFASGEIALANGAIVSLPPDPTGQLTLQLSVTTGMAGPGNYVHLILDTTGYFQ